MRVIRLIKDARDAAQGGGGRALLELLTPKQAEGRGPIVRALLTGATASLLALGMALALQAAALLLAALGIIYFLMTQVLGIKIDMDPRLVMQQAGQKASSSVLN